MEDSTADLIVFIFVVIVIIVAILRVVYASPEKLDKMAKGANKRRSDAIKRGIRNSQMYGTKKSRKIKY